MTIDFSEKLEKILNDSAPSNIQYAIYGETHIFDQKAKPTDSGKVLIQGIVSNPAGLYTPIKGLNIINENAVLTIWFPIENYAQAMDGLNSLREALVGLVSYEDGKAVKWSMDVPSLSSVDQMALRGFSQEDARFVFGSEIYGRAQVRIYQTAVDISQAMIGDQFQISYTGDDGRSYPIRYTSMTASRLDNPTMAQGYNDYNARGVIESAQVSFSVNAIYDPNPNGFLATLLDDLRNNEWSSNKTYDIDFTIVTGDRNSQQDTTTAKMRVVNPSFSFSNGAPVTCVFTLMFDLED